MQQQKKKKKKVLRIECSSKTSLCAKFQTLRIAYLSKFRNVSEQTCDVHSSVSWAQLVSLCSCVLIKIRPQELTKNVLDQLCIGQSAEIDVSLLLAIFIFL